MVEAQATGSTATIDFPLLKLVNEARATYGLRHQDYARYHKNKKFVKKDVTPDKVSSAKHLQILLFETERAWAHAQQIKANVSNAQTSSGSQRHLTKRLSKAVARSQHLVSVIHDSKISSKLSSSHQAQVMAYHVVMQGTHDFERSRLEQGLKTLSVAHELLVKIADTSSSAHEQALANEVVDDVEPMLRFCAYKTGLDTSQGVASLAQTVASKEANNVVSDYDQLVQQLDSQRPQSSKETVELSWRGKEIPVRSAELVDVVIKVKQALDSLEADKANDQVEISSAVAKDVKSKKKKRTTMSSRRMATYDKALLVLSDAEAVASQLVEDNKVALSKSTSARHEASSAPLQMVRSYIVYQLLAVRIKRDLLLVQDTALKLSSREAKIKDKELEYITKTGHRNERKAEQKIKRQRSRLYPSIVKLYDNVVQSLEQMRDLEAVEQDDELALKVEARIDFALASRCTFLARSYALVDQYPSALSLNSRGQIYSRSARRNASSAEAAAEQDYEDVDFADDLLTLNSDMFDPLDHQLEQDYQNFGKAWYNATGGKVGKDVEPEDLPVDDLGLDDARVQRDDNKNNKTKKTPAFYDVAFNYIAAFDMEAIARRAGMKPSQRSAEDEEDDEFHEAGQEDDDTHNESGDEAMHDAEDGQDSEEEEEQQQPAKKGWGFGLFGRR
ncbi:signal recognition particle subunit srp68 [Microbotryomycetes sp. JL221]|nr:signal recognition particle subunit srp68 [Microbotryomycetes sp. JL221]